MLKLYPGNTLLLTYQPLVIKKKIQGFLLAKKEQKNSKHILQEILIIKYKL